VTAAFSLDLPLAVVMRSDMKDCARHGAPPPLVRSAMGLPANGTGPPEHEHCDRTHQQRVDAPLMGR